MFALLTGYELVTLPGLSSTAFPRDVLETILLACSLSSRMSTVIITSEAVLM